MLTSIKNILFSTKLTALLLFVFAAAIGVATFIENDFGTPAAKNVVFNTKWLELVLLLLTINLIGNIFRYKMFQKSKLAILMFHLAFILVLIGAGITRYIGFEGLMRLREGETSNVIVSEQTYLQFKVDNQKVQYTFEKPLFLNPLYNQKFDVNFHFENNDIHVKFKDFIPNSVDTVVDIENGKKLLEIVTVGEGGRVSRYIESGTTRFFGDFPVAFNDNTLSEAIKINETENGLTVLSPYDIQFLSMDDQSTGIIVRDSIQPFVGRRLYTVGGVQLVFKELHSSAEIKKISAPKDVRGEDALVVDVVCEDSTNEVTLFGGKGYTSRNTIFQMKGLNFSLAYGSKEIILPFNIRLDDFHLEKYPGSMSPSSYESKVTLSDNRNGKTFSQLVYMNNVLDYDGYRFFQSSYEQDELGSILSVNHDYWGTIVTYIGYFFLMLGMALTLISKKSRFNSLHNSIKNIRLKREALTLLLFATVGVGFAQNNPHQTSEYVVIDETHAEKFGKLLVQDAGGRIKPLQTLTSEVMRKVMRSEEFQNMNSNQVILSMMYNPGYWQKQAMIKVSHPELEKKLKATDNYASFVNFFDKDFNYILAKDADEANRKKPAERSKYDKEVIAVDERANICFMVYQGAMLRIFPKDGDTNNTWYSGLDYKNFTSHDSIFVKSIGTLYFAAINESFATKKWQSADSILKHISDFQHKFGGLVIPKQSKIDTEILYNKIQIFDRLFKYYVFTGLLMMFFLLSDIFSAKKWKLKVVYGLSVFLFILFLLHTIGLGARWYISGYAPWSNGYESMIYIAWATLLAGFLFSKTSKMALAATAKLTSLILMVAHLNWLDPEITPLVPVLKSYWLMIHVAVITASYGFLGLGALLGLLNLILMIVKSKNNKEKVSSTIKELTLINEMTLTIGVFLATAGTFLGGVWANESWGRYWGWDPKETWALVIMLVYAMILHLRFIPKANGKYLFNFLSVIGFSTVIMTYFGVNYYLSGLHSYAKGDPVPIPTFVPITVGVILIISTIAFFRNRRIGEVSE
ncbi:MAG: c-type cytochrome biogenesis protein CcsB [Flavobacteriales bacterium]|nr:c-type cytochrome biogenesis protein CcsB [Flavobacteriales bacterium]